MKKFLSSHKYGVWNTIFLVIFVLVLDFGIYSQIYGIELDSEVYLRYEIDGEEKLIEEYKDNELYKFMMSNRDKMIEEDEEKLSQYEEGTKEYQEIKNRIDFCKRYYTPLVIQQVIRKETYDAKVKKTVITVDSVIFIVYLLGCMIGSKKKPVKKGRK